MQSKGGALLFYKTTSSSFRTSSPFTDTKTANMSHPIDSVNIWSLLPEIALVFGLHIGSPPPQYYKNKVTFSFVQEGNGGKQPCIPDPKDTNHFCSIWWPSETFWFLNLLPRVFSFTWHLRILLKKLNLKTISCSPAEGCGWRLCYTIWSRMTLCY